MGSFLFLNITYPDTGTYIDMYYQGALLASYSSFTTSNLTYEGNQYSGIQLPAGSDSAVLYLRYHTLINNYIHQWCSGTGYDTLHFKY